ncbi:hypothetical protein BCR37DRAFT_376487 [Protomyces lactucae-debilis]|uniref:Uncharacterized protein n=1 Tax=Protomyces lactucae-debilis TaxID=2754530 RepID=A0A1Y2FJ53_PROLT|nr:uncharacterized protein BCR37DRAFT_379329 [Protomyces lactucae-debilis]XP_040727956.1 uncharacterized protein BCR37DRAFT_376487 [Protomyces lactucae-debilis]ORY83286.1 hypothetical protein BCR37DRAFT_379329 [Protomyces lactucae-debilis]ORY87100.1 hypothetical protein BCR37DRAFT_376487 [Protomyces lactucae-debilis]
MAGASGGPMGVLGTCTLAMSLYWWAASELIWFHLACSPVPLGVASRLKSSLRVAALQSCRKSAKDSMCVGSFRSLLIDLFARSESM